MDTRMAESLQQQQTTKNLHQELNGTEENRF